jgi:hypothetical protein
VGTDPTPARATKWRAARTADARKIAEGGRRPPAAVGSFAFLNAEEMIHSHTRVFSLGARRDRAKWRSERIFSG